MIMKKLNLWLFLSLFVAAFSLTACSSSDDSTSEGGGGGNPDAPVNPGSLKYAALSGIVTDGYTPMGGVTVTSGTVSVKTGLNGTYTFDKVNVVSGRAVVKFEKEGYASVTRSIPVANEMHLDVAMTNYSEVRTYSSGGGVTTTVRDAQWNKYVTLELPSGNYKNGNTTYSGQVTASAVYLNPEQVETFANRMPGDLTTDKDQQLVSLGMVSVDLEGANGEKLELPEGKTATLTFPVPANAKQTPATMPLWSFDETTGLWVEEGTATYDASNNVYVGEVSHFSWHNLDYPEVRATLKVKVVDPNGNPIAYLPVDFDGQRVMYTDGEGFATCVVPSNTKMYVSVKSEDYGNYAMTYSDDNPWGTYDESKIVKKELTLDPQDTKTIELKMPSRASIISGVVTNSGSGSKVCTLHIAYGTMQTTTSVISDLDGKFWLYAPANYKGSAKLVALFGGGIQATQAFEIDGKDKTVNVSVESDSGANGGIFQISGNGVNFKYVVKDALKGTSSLGDGTLNISLTDLDDSKEFDHMTGSMHYISISIPNYDSSKSSFADAEVYFGTEGHGAGRVGLEMKGTLQLTKKGSTYSFKMANVKGTVQEDQDRNIQWPGIDVTVNAEFSGTVTSE